MPDNSFNFSTQHIQDFSESLSENQLNSLEQQASQTSFQTHVVILPSTYSPQSIDRLATTLTSKLDGQNHLLIVIDTTEHNVRAKSGQLLANNGLTEKTLGQILPKAFNREHTLEEAISTSINMCKDRLASSTKTTTKASTTTTTQANFHNNTNTNSGFSWTGALLLVAIALAIVGVYFWRLKVVSRDFSKSENDNLRFFLFDLRNKANELGMLAQNIEPTVHEALAKKIAGFFMSMDSLDQAEAELNDLVSSGKLSEANKALTRCVLLARTLLAQVDHLIAEAKQAQSTEPSTEAPTQESAPTQPEATPTPSSGNITVATTSEGVPANQPSEQNPVDIIQSVEPQVNVTDLSTAAAIVQTAKLSYHRPAWTQHTQYLMQPQGWGSSAIGNVLVLLGLYELSSHMNNLHMNHLHNFVSMPSTIDEHYVASAKEHGFYLDNHSSGGVDFHDLVETNHSPDPKFWGFSGTYAGYFDSHGMPDFQLMDGNSGFDHGIGMDDIGGMDFDTDFGADFDPFDFD